MERIFFYCLIFWGFICSASAQQDFLVTLKGDTLYGTVFCTWIGQSQRIEYSTGKKKQFFTPVQIRHFRSGNENYFPVRTANGYQIMKLLKPGYLSLYAFQLENQVSWDGLYLLKKDGTGMEYSGLLFKKRVSKFLEDCPVVSQQVEEKELKRSDLDEIIDLYNQCIEQRTQEQTTTSQMLLRWEELEQKIMAKPDFEGRTDALDMIREIKRKVDNKEPVPKFLRESLRTLLKPHADLSELLEQLLTKI
jgi:hypothetical protein